MSYMTNFGKQALLWFLLWLAIVLASLAVVPPLIVFMVGVSIIGRKYQGTIFVPCKEVIQKPVLHDGIDMCRLLADFVDDVTLGNDRQPWPSGFFFGIVGGALYRYHIEGVKDIVEEGCQQIGEPIDHWDLIVGDMDDARSASDDTLRTVLERISETIKLPKYKGKICVHLDQFLPSSLFGNLNNYPPFAERIARIPLTAFPMYGKNGAEERPLYMGSVYDGMWFYEHGACAKHLKDKHIQRLNALQGKFMGGKYAAQ